MVCETLIRSILACSLYESTLIFIISSGVKSILPNVIFEQRSGMQKNEASLIWLFYDEERVQVVLSIVCSNHCIMPILSQCMFAFRWFNDNICASLGN